jgi:hypothetical protein
MNATKFERFILKKMKATEPFCWDLLNETGSSIVDQIVEDEEQGPSKEWGPMGWYRHPTEESIQQAAGGETFETSAREAI